ncbi:hypothetical protein C8Q79DRAFT_918900 [Trametes meyenii]|nr:hypothetical protein C8Q79DRAFT_918900 [Trametes meyenii]
MCVTSFVSPSSQGGHATSSKSAKKNGLSSSGSLSSFLHLCFGRGTRGYIALDVKARRFVFLKDSWRPFYFGVEPEGYYLTLLSLDGPESIDVPKLVAHGDVGDQVTFAALYARHIHEKKRAAIRKQTEAASNANLPNVAPPLDHPGSSQTAGQKRSREHIEAETADAAPAAASVDVDEHTGPVATHDSFSFRCHKHYRLVVMDVCLPFTEVTSSYQLLQMIYHCITTHHRAYKYHRVLHRDVSAGNVIIRPQLKEDPERRGWFKVEWVGILTDWELAKVVPEDSQKQVTRQPERTGTWQFMSVAYVENHPTPVTVADELESFFHVILFYAVRLLRHNIPSVNFFVIDYFDGYNPAAGKVGRTCSETKTNAIRFGTFNHKGVPIRFYLKDGTLHEDLNGLFYSWLEYFQARYTVLDWTRDEKLRAKQQTQSVLRKPRKGGLDPPPRLSAPAAHNPRPVPLGPSDKTRNLAQLLDIHDAVMNVVYEALSGVDTYTGNERLVHWPDGPDEDDGVPDLFPESYDPRSYLLAVDRISAASGGSGSAAIYGIPPLKRIRTQGSSSHTAPPASSSGQDLADEDPFGQIMLVKDESRKGKGRSSRS